MSEIPYPNEVRIPFPNEISQQYEIRACENDPSAGNGRHYYKVKAFTLADEPDFEMVVNFQKGPLPQTGHNGILSNVLLAILIDHLKSYQTGQFSSRETACAITKLEEAYHWIAARADDRASRNVLGAHAK